MEAELDQLVAEELAAVTPPSVEEPIELALAKLAARLRAHPDREALLERLRREALEAPRDTPAARPAMGHRRHRDKGHVRRPDRELA